MSITPRIEELRKKFEENPRRYFAPLANELRKAGELAQAIALCHEHLPKQPGHMSGHIVFGQALYEHGDLEQGRTVFEQALALDPENLIALRHLGDIARRLGDAPAARRWYERVLEADPRNDDIAAQLATLATGATPLRNVAVPAPESEVGAGWTVDESAIAEVEAMPTLTPMRAFAEPPVAEETPVLFDLESIEASAPAVEPEVDVEPPANADPFFGAPGESFPSAESADVASDAEQAFEEGLAAVEWPDTSDFAHRITLPRGITPISASVTPEAVDAFGREPNDVIIPALPEPEPDLIEVTTVLATPAAAVPAVETELFWIAPPGATHDEDDEQEPAHDEAVGGFAPSDDDEPVAVFDEAESEPLGVAEADTEDAELPWLAAPVTPDAEVGAIVEAFAEDARSKGESDGVSVISMPEPSAPEPVAAAAESSFADIMGDQEQETPETDTLAPVTTSAGAFVTETMGELFVAQGLTDRAIGVYEELVRRRPHDLAPAARLAELRAQSAAGQPPASAPARTARARFAALAARRVDRRAPASSVAGGAPGVATPSAPMGGAVPAAGSLASLFDSAPTTDDEQAALGFASAFGSSARASGSDSFFGSESTAVGLAETPGAGAARVLTPFGASAATSPAPAAIVAAEESYAFDRFFPDPASAERSPGRPTPSVSETGAARSATPPAGDSKAADDLAQFSAWLKGLGSP